MKANLNFGARMKEKRKQQGLTQQQAAEMSNISLRHWQSLESGSLPSLKTAVQIAAAIRLDLNEMRDALPVPPIPPKR